MCIRDRHGVNGRLDMLALYGPCLNYHSADVCFCRQCKRISVLDEIHSVLKDKILNEASKLGIALNNNQQDSLRSLNMTQKNIPKLQMAPIRLLNEESIQRIWNELCPQCKNHCENYRHLVCGQQQQHIMTCLLYTSPSPRDS
eukprot:TRINITY_DN15446_c0_g1_i1.p1 TRINITY_DN15446_c0_g1~~TRINITY_DN15446_c0_g1_i1.p1  ORF type:complete len:143 (+),score=17.55 TRINITY_DN15446_c0_g1_i1:64-492(+)